MSRYVDKKHGLILGSGNVFFFRDEEKALHEFNAVVWAQGLYFPDHSTAHGNIQSMAEQFIWDEWEEVVEKPYEMDGETIMLPIHVTHRKPSTYVTYWLNENAPGWGVQPPPLCGRDSSPSIFFAKRSHALAFTKMVEEMLDGVTFI
jgi:hypothetical protein